MVRAVTASTQSWTNAAPAARGGAIVDTGVGSTLRDVRFVKGLQHAWEKHLTGSGATSLRTLDPGGSIEKWAAHVVKLAGTGEGVPRAVQGGQVLELMAPMTREAGGSLKVGVRLFNPAGATVWELTTILTRQ
jgi:hypothetical protein